MVEGVVGERVTPCNDLAHNIRVGFRRCPDEKEGSSCVVAFEKLEQLWGVVGMRPVIERQSRNPFVRCNRS